MTPEEMRRQVAGALKDSAETIMAMLVVILFWLVLIVLLLVAIVGECLTTESEDSTANKQTAQAELDALRNANRINLAAWQARQATRVEAARHRESGDQPW